MRASARAPRLLQEFLSIHGKDGAQDSAGKLRTRAAGRYALGPGCPANCTQESKLNLELRTGTTRALGSPGSCLARDHTRRVQPLQELLAQSIKAAIGHDEQQIARLGVRRKVLCNCVRARKHAGISSKRAHTLSNSLRIEPIFVTQLLRSIHSPQNYAIAQ